MIAISDALELTQNLHPEVRIQAYADDIKFNNRRGEGVAKIAPAEDTLKTLLQEAGFTLDSGKREWI